MVFQDEYNTSGEITFEMEEDLEYGQSNPFENRAKSGNAKRIIGFSFVFLFCLVAHWFYDPNTSGCELLTNKNDVSRSFDEHLKLWVFKPTDKNGKLMLLHNENGHINTQGEVAVNTASRYFNTVVNFAIGFWMIQCFPICVGLEDYFGTSDNATSLETCLWSVAGLAILKLFSLFLVSYNQLETCTYTLVKF